MFATCNGVGPACGPAAEHRVSGREKAEASGEAASLIPGEHQACLHDHSCNLLAPVESCSLLAPVETALVRKHEEAHFGIKEI